MTHESRPYRIVFVSTMNGVAWGGSEQLWSETALELRRRGHEVSASVLKWPTRPAPLDALAEQGVDLAFRPRRRRYIDRALQKILKRISPGALDFAHRWWLKRRAADLVVVSQGGPWDGLTWMLACHRFGIPYCAIVQANSELWWPLDPWLDGIRTAVGGARRMYFVSRANHALMELQCGRRLPNAEVIANPCKVDHSSAVAWPEDDDRVHLACVGRMSPNAKGQDVLLQVLAQPKWRERPIDLHLYGAGPSERSIRALVDLLELNNVHFHGQVGDVRSIWTGNHLLVLPSRFEGLPLTIVEAMLCGRPVVTTAVAGNTEAVEDGVTGFVADAATVASLDDAMERAWARRGSWREMGARARQETLLALPADPVRDFTDKILDLIGHRQDRGENAAPTRARQAAAETQAQPEALLAARTTFLSAK